ncbi:hypothetical protein [Pyrococcus kukulkanii]|uniref:Uncharacterized protein n=1 Tax=Pyrococcus kukulkanii TaxID=1609559 RepID=A0ABV4T7K8_9EURY
MLRVDAVEDLKGRLVAIVKVFDVDLRAVKKIGNPLRAIRHAKIDVGYYINCGDIILAIEDVSGEWHAHVFKAEPGVVGPIKVSRVYKKGEKVKFVKWLAKQVKVAENVESELVKDLLSLIEKYSPEVVMKAMNVALKYYSMRDIIENVKNISKSDRVYLLVKTYAYEDGGLKLTLANNLQIKVRAKKVEGVYEDPFTLMYVFEVKVKDEVEAQNYKSTFPDSVLFTLPPGAIPHTITKERVEVLKCPKCGARLSGSEFLQCPRCLWRGNPSEAILEEDYTVKISEPGRADILRGVLTFLREFDFRINPITYDIVPSEYIRVVKSDRLLKIPLSADLDSYTIEVTKGLFLCGRKPMKGVVLKGGNTAIIIVSDETITTDEMESMIIQVEAKGYEGSP